MRSFSKWQITGTRGGTLPSCFLGSAPPLPPNEMPPEISLLLPRAGSAQDVVDDLPNSLPAGAGLALFLADPNLNPARLARRMRERRLSWVCNLPSVGQHEHEFRRYLREVDLDHDREMRALETLSGHGISTIATVSSPLDCHAVAQAAAVFVLPPLPDFSHGLPHLERRTQLESRVRAAAPGVLLLGLREEGEGTVGLDAAVRRPEPFTP